MSKREVDESPDRLRTANADNHPRDARLSSRRESGGVISDSDVEKAVAGAVGVDSGGSFNKMVYFRPVDAPNLPTWVFKEESLPNSVPGLRPDPNLHFSSGILRFIKFPRHQTSAFIDFCKKVNLPQKFNINHLNMTGGGAYRYAEEIQQKMNIQVHKLDEMETLINGLDFLLKHDLSEEVFTIDPVTKEQKFGILDHLAPKEVYPFLLVNMGSGVSLLKINGPGAYERVSGTSLGGGTFWGLARLLTNVESSTESDSWADVQALSEHGDSNNVDLLVGDIYGEEEDKYAKLGLNKEIIASSFGKVATAHVEGSTVRDQFKSEDIVRSLMKMIANNIGQIAFLVAELHGLERIVFAGGFIEHNMFLWHKFSFAIDFWSKGKKQALFLRHNGYLGALGAIIHREQEDS